MRKPCCWRNSTPKAGTLTGQGLDSRHRLIQLEEIYKVLVTGLRDYVHKNGFSDVVFGLSGGIDSGLTLALAVDALGPEHVHTVMMPSRHTSGLSIELAQEQAVAFRCGSSLHLDRTGLRDDDEPAVPVF